MYHVNGGKGQIWKKHLDQLRYRFGDIHQPAIPSTGPTDSTVGDNVHYQFEQDAPPPEQDAPDPPPGIDALLPLENELTPRGNTIPQNIVEDQFTGNMKNHLAQEGGRCSNLPSVTSR